MGPGTSPKGQFEKAGSGKASFLVGPEISDLDYNIRCAALSNPRLIS
jgi:hypothetical protein